MSNPPEVWKNWEGRVVDEKFPLLRWLGGSNHSAVFLTERGGGEPQKAVIKLISAENLDESPQLSRWADAAKLSHSHLIHLFECGRCQLDDTRLLYVVMEYADEDLAQILPLRALAPNEIPEMLEPTAQALAFVHRAGYIHGGIQPSNVMAVNDQLKISSDGLRKAGERPGARESSAYQAPEVSTEGVSPASDAWSLAATLVAALTQREPERNNSSEIAVPEALPQPFRDIAIRCLRRDPRQRYTVTGILNQLRGESAQETIAPTSTRNARPRQWILVPVTLAALFLLAFAGREFFHRPPAPAAETAQPQSQPTDSSPPKAQPPPAPSLEKQTETSRETTRGTVLQQILPEVSRGAQKTIQGRVKVIVRVAVDTSGNVSQATLTSAGPSKYFANKATAAARQWKFKAPQANGQPEASEWLLRFQFGRSSTQVFPTEVRP
jgi:TonB family protein